MTRFEQLESKMLEYKWLLDIEKKYQEMIDLINREIEHFTIYGFAYAARGDVQHMSINPHRSIPVRYLKQGLEAALVGVRREIADLEVDLKEWMEEV